MGTPGQGPRSNTRRLSSPALEDHCAWLGCPCWGSAQECVGVAGACGRALQFPCQILQLQRWHPPQLPSAGPRPSVSPSPIEGRLPEPHPVTLPPSVFQGHPTLCPPKSTTGWLCGPGQMP